MLTVRKATEADAHSLASRLRQADLLELSALNMGTPSEVLAEGVRVSSKCLVAVDDDDQPQIIFGVNPSHSPSEGWVWMVASDDLEKHWRQVLRESRLWLSYLTEGYASTGNIVHSQNIIHIKWLRWLGYAFYADVQFNGHTFHAFSQTTGGFQ